MIYCLFYKCKTKVFSVSFTPGSVCSLYRGIFSGKPEVIISFRGDIHSYDKCKAYFCIKQVSLSNKEFIVVQQ